MGKILAIDHGNTRTKVAVFEGDRLYETIVVESLNVESLLPLMERYVLCGAIYGSVGHVDPKFAETLRHLLDGELIIFTSNTPVPLKIDYSTPQTLGTDRVAAGVAVAKDYGEHSVLVIDAGSALTCDIVCNATFRRGNISPGLNMRFRALHSFTGRLPHEKWNGEILPLFGTSTSEAIRCGVVNGFIAEIEKAIAEGKKNYGVSRVVITGGDAAMVAPTLGEETEIIADPDLVVRGLNQIYLYNETI